MINIIRNLEDLRDCQPITTMQSYHKIFETRRKMLNIASQHLYTHVIVIGINDVALKLQTVPPETTV